MKTRHLAVTLFVSILSLLNGAEPTPSITHSSGQVSVKYSTEIGRCYEVWASTDLAPGGWSGPLDTQIGSGALKTALFSTAGFEKRVFQVRVSDLAPSFADFAALAVGDYLPNTIYFLTSSTRFHWNGEYGNWSYTKTGTNTATIVFTYDEDGNNPGVYREQVILTYTEKGAGTFSYGEYNFGVLDLGSVASGPFSFN